MKVVVFCLKYNGLDCRTCHDLPAVKELYWAYEVFKIIPLKWSFEVHLVLCSRVLL